MIKAMCLTCDPHGSNTPRLPCLPPISRPPIVVPRLLHLARMDAFTRAIGKDPPSIQKVTILPHCPRLSPQPDCAEHRSIRWHPWEGAGNCDATKGRTRAEADIVITIEDRIRGESMRHCKPGTTKRNAHPERSMPARHRSVASLRQQRQSGNGTSLAGTRPGPAPFDMRERSPSAGLVHAPEHKPRWHRSTRISRHRPKGEQPCRYRRPNSARKHQP